MATGSWRQTGSGALLFIDGGGDIVATIFPRLDGAWSLLVTTARGPAHRGDFGTPEAAIVAFDRGRDGENIAAPAAARWERAGQAAR